MASLSPKTTVLGKRLAAHLLRRATYHFSPERIDAFAIKTAEEAVDELCDILPSLQFPNGPINWNNGTPIFDEARAVTNFNNGINNFFQSLALYQWRILEMYFDPSIRQKLTVWLDSIWVVGNPEMENPAAHFARWRLLQTFALGNIKAFAKKITVDNEMLVFLNNNENTKESPNENYAREFLELFTILRGAVQAVGDYTTYTEADVSTAARLLTGFKDNFFSGNVVSTDAETGLGTGTPNYSDHDTDDKMFSAAFNNQVITGAVDEQDMYRELSDFVDMVFNQLATAQAYCRKLYLFFVSDIITQEIEEDIIQPLAIELLNNDYELLPTIMRLLKSQHFYDEDDGNTNNEIIGGKIKSPYELNITPAAIMNGLTIPLNNYRDLFEKTSLNYVSLFEKEEMPLGGPASVEGFFGYYKAPAFSRNWFNSNTFFNRYNTATYLLRGWWRNANEPIPFKVDPLDFVVNNISNPSDGTTLVTEFMQCFLPELPTENRFDYFLNALYGDLSPTNWFFAWQNFVNTGEDMEVRLGVENFYLVVFNSPEFQLF